MAGCALALVGAVEVAACSDDDSGGNAATGGEDGRGDAAGAPSHVSAAGQTGALQGGGESNADAGATSSGAGNAGAGGAAGAGVDSSGGAGPNPCRIDLAEFLNNGYRTCPPNDSAAVAGECWPQAENEYATGETCGNYRIWAFGHDGRIGCAYDAFSGDLVGGFLYGLPSSAPSSCPAAVAGPRAIQYCRPPTTPWCPDGLNETGGAGGQSGAASVQGGAGGVAPQGGAAGQP